MLRPERARLRKRRIDLLEAWAPRLQHSLLTDLSTDELSGSYLTKKIGTPSKGARQESEDARKMWVRGRALIRSSKVEVETIFSNTDYSDPPTRLL